MNIYFIEDNTARNFDPISLSRPIMAIRCGQKTFLEWNRSQLPKDSNIILIVRKELEDITKELYSEFAVNPDSLKDGYWVKSTAVLTRDEWDSLIDKKSVICKNGEIIAGYIAHGAVLDGDGITIQFEQKSELQQREMVNPLPHYLWEILPLAHHLQENHLSKIKQKIIAGNFTVIQEENVSVDTSAEILPNVVLDASQGPITIEKGVKIYPFCYVQGPAHIGSDSVLSPFTQFMHSYCGPMCKLGGEIHNTIIQGFSNKVHDGHLGDSFLGEWVNLGAGTTNSNLKNNYKVVSVVTNGNVINTGTLFAGSYIGDHSKTAIGTLLNTGTVIGPGCNIISSTFPPKVIRPFTWYINGKHRQTQFDKFTETAKTSMRRRGKTFSSVQEKIFARIFQNR